MQKIVFSLKFLEMSSYQASSTRATNCKDVYAHFKFCLFKIVSIKDCVYLESYYLGSCTGSPNKAFCCWDLELCGDSLFEQ